MRARVYKFAIGLSIAFVIDGIFMAWALLAGDYAGLGYLRFIFIPIFLPATLVALVITGIYLYGFARLSWRPRRIELVFFLLFFLAWTVKIVGQVLYGN